MVRIRCHYDDCVFLNGLYCSAAEIELDPKKFCLTYNPVNQAEPEVEDDVDVEEEEDLESWEELEGEEEEEEWGDEDADEY